MFTMGSFLVGRCRWPHAWHCELQVGRLQSEGAIQPEILEKMYTGGLLAVLAAASGELSGDAELWSLAVGGAALFAAAAVLHC
jgi:hypothetical protein